MAPLQVDYVVYYSCARPQLAGSACRWCRSWFLITHPRRESV